VKTKSRYDTACTTTIREVLSIAGDGRFKTAATKTRTSTDYARLSFFKTQHAIKKCMKFKNVDNELI